MEEPKDPYIILKLLLVIVVIDALFIGVLGVEGIVAYGGWVIGGGTVLMAVLGMYLKAEEAEAEAEEAEAEEEEADAEPTGIVWAVIPFVILSLIGIVFYVWMHKDELLSKKYFIVFNYDMSERNVTIEGKTYTIKPASRQTVTVQGKTVHVNGRPYTRNGRYLVNASENVCYKLEKLLLTTATGAISAMAIPLSLPELYDTETIRARVHYDNSDNYIVFPGESFRFQYKDMDKYKAVILTACGLE